MSEEGCRIPEPAAGVMQVGRHWLRLRTDEYGAVDVVLCDEAGTELESGYLVSFSDDDDKLVCWRHEGVDSDHCLTDDEGRIQDVTDW
jgi:hypothetical protein